MKRLNVLLLASIAACLIAIGCGKREKYAGEWRDLCNQNLQKIEAAKNQWALELKKYPGDMPTDAEIIGNNGYIREKPACPANGTYSLNRIGSRASCSIPSHNQ